MPELKYRMVGSAVRSVDLKSRRVEVVASTPCIDSYGEIVEQTWDLKRYARNPVVLWSHKGSELPLGRAENVRIVGGELVATLVLASEKANPKSEQVLQLFAEGALKGVSVGFNPKKTRREERNGELVTVLSENELFEISVTPVPANPEAVSRSSGARAATAPASPKTTLAEEAARRAAVPDEGLHEAVRRAREVMGRSLTPKPAPTKTEAQRASAALAEVVIARMTESIEDHVRRVAAQPWSLS